MLWTLTFVWYRLLPCTSDAWTVHSFFTNSAWSVVLYNVCCNELCKISSLYAKSPAWYKLMSCNSHAWTVHNKFISSAWSVLCMNYAWTYECAMHATIVKTPTLFSRSSVSTPHDNQLLTWFIPPYPGELVCCDPLRRCREGPLKAAPTRMGRWTLATNEKRTQHPAHTGWNFQAFINCMVRLLWRDWHWRQPFTEKKTGKGMPGETPCLSPYATRVLFSTSAFQHALVTQHHLAFQLWMSFSAQHQMLFSIDCLILKLPRTRRTVPERFLTGQMTCLWKKYL